MGYKENEKNHDKNITARGKGGENIKLLVEARIKEYIEQNNIEKAKEVLNDNKEYIKNRIYKRWSRQIYLAENKKMNEKSILAQVLYLLVLLAITIIFMVIIFLNMYYLQKGYKFIMIINSVIVMTLFWKINNIIKWAFKGKYGYKFPMENLCGLDILFWILVLIFDILLSL